MSSMSSRSFGPIVSPIGAGALNRRGTSRKRFDVGGTVTNLGALSGQPELSAAYNGTPVSMGQYYLPQGGTGNAGPGVANGSTAGSTNSAAAGTQEATPSNIANAVLGLASLGNPLGILGIAINGIGTAASNGIGVGGSNSSTASGSNVGGGAPNSAGDPGAPGGGTAAGAAAASSGPGGNGTGGAASAAGFRKGGKVGALQRYAKGGAPHDKTKVAVVMPTMPVIAGALAHAIMIHRHAEMLRRHIIVHRHQIAHHRRVA